MRFSLPGLLALIPATVTLLKKYKLTEGLEVDRKQHFEAYGDHRDQDMSAKVNCWAKKGVAAIGFAGSNNDDVWNTYSRFLDEF